MALRSPTRNLDAVVESLRFRLGDDLIETTDNDGQLIARVSPERRPDALRALKDDLSFDLYVFCGAVDWPAEERFDILDHVQSLAYNQRVTLKCSVPRDAPRVPTGTVVFRGADWHERETWELFGIVFTGHPQLRRLLLPDWQEGFPMRKDYELPARVEKPWPGDWFSG